jgi:hypothetical protein
MGREVREVGKHTFTFSLKIGMNEILPNPGRKDKHSSQSLVGKSS